ncbi:disease resistance protein RUN1-like [Eucalyptus grandis]|uniref:disease resistance protein RUN1-like n=1 Tax=Eucalyptus grandis TaxID=71139 RepID=UPI00192F01B1|nr:disease resistance protein RUN1-like [Eucalyptus grandis]
MECKKTSGQIVLPVFYNVKPHEVRELQGAFGEAFKFGMHRFKEEDVKQKALVALRELVDSRVFESEKTTNGREGELVNELVEIIMRKQQQDFQPHLPVNLVAIEDRVAEVMELVDLACPDTRIIGIWGMGGIGKTTLATIIYKKLFDNFQYRCSLKDIRETTKSKGIEHVQSLLISDISKGPKSTVRDPEIGINKIRLSCHKKKVLILLDDVDRRDHLDNLIGGSNFESGSRIIITCRDMALLDCEYKQYELKEMDYEESMLLFSRYAFEAERPPTELEALSHDIVNTTGGLPLALTVIGSLLKRRDKSIWKEMLEKLRKMPHKEVQEKLKLSYNTLEDNEKQLFLDIACIFIGTYKRIATYLWRMSNCTQILHWQE